MATVSFQDLGKVIKEHGEGMIKAGTIALNVTAKNARINLQNEMDKVFDKPTPYAKRAIWVDFATDDKQEVTIKVMDQPSSQKVTSPINFLGPEIEGGRRKPKRAEIALRLAGVLVPGMLIAPGPAIKLDSYGNIPRGTMQKILANTRSYRDPLQRSKAGKQKYFVRGGPIPDGKPGKIIFMRQGSSSIPAIFPIKPVNYKPRFKFFEVIDETFIKDLNKNYDYWINRLSKI